MTGFKVIRPGVLTLIQDLGRIGYHRMGITTGGPLDPFAFTWANRLCDNPVNSTVLEISIGGLTLDAQLETTLVLTGAEMPIKINGIERERWRTHPVKPGDRIEIGYSQAGLRSYLAVAGGFQVAPQFGSTATVIRERLGGLNGGPIRKGDLLRARAAKEARCYRLPMEYQPHYRNDWPLRVVTGYQHQCFSLEQQKRFFTSSYQITDLADRMGYRLQGAEIAPPDTRLLSEGISLGAIQVPPDGQPIVLLNDRQTIGGYPKLGAMLSLDVARLTQKPPGTDVRFEAISQDEAVNHLQRARQFFEQIKRRPV